MQRFRVSSGKGAYSVVVGRGAWRALRRFPLKRYTSVFVLTERLLWQRWEDAFSAESGLRRPQVLFVPTGEIAKSIRWVEEVALGLLAAGADRKSLLIVFGGGVVGDLGGFVASTYMRGIDYVQVPTTVVAQVDSSVGGKTGVNAGLMKNLIGAFYPPRLVVADPQVLASLPNRAFRSGLYEIVKHAILAGSPFFDQLEDCIGQLDPRNTKSLESILAKAVKVKIDIVARDERESGLRRVLNLGHTFGHALEEATSYRRFLHGEAVGWGLLAATRLGWRLGLLDAGKRGGTHGERILRLIEQVGPLPPLGNMDPAKVLELLPKDKKTVGRRIHWIVPERIGRVRIVAGIVPAVVAAALRDIQDMDRTRVRRARHRAALAGSC